MKKGKLAFLLSLSLLLAGCGQDAANIGAAVPSASADETTAAASGQFTDRDYEVGYDESESALVALADGTASSESDAVRIAGGTVTLISEGTYILSGTLADGMIVVDAGSTDKLHIVLDGVSICSQSSAALYIKQADKVFVTLAPGSENTLENGGQFIAIDENNIDAAVFSKDDLTFNGAGSLTVVSPAGHGVVSKDDLVFTSGSYAVTAASHALSGKDCVKIAGGSFALTAGKDGVQAENEDDASLGYVYIAGGSFAITAQGDGLSASGTLEIAGGAFDITSGGGSASATADSDAWYGFFRDSQTVQDASTSAKGIKAAGNLLIGGGSFLIDAADDALHSNADITITGGEYTIASGDDALHADALAAISGGTIHITRSYEGIEGLNIEISGGDITLVSSDDGLNAAGGNDQSGYGGFRGRDVFAANADCSITISGGILRIDASGDGIDSNGSLLVSGGETYVSGPTNSANGALDYASEAVITGGVFVAAGASGMAQSFSASSAQGVIAVSLRARQAGAALTLMDEAGNTLVSWQADKAFDSVVISCPEIVQGATYTLTAGDTTAQVTAGSQSYGAGGGMDSWQGGGWQGGGGRGGGGRR